MNMSDIRATQMNQHDFWRMYASAVVALAILTVVAVLSRLAWQAKHSLTGLPRKPDDFVAGPANDKLDFDAV